MNDENLQEAFCTALKTGMRFDSGYYDPIKQEMKKRRLFFRQRCKFYSLDEGKYLMHNFYDMSDLAVYGKWEKYDPNDILGNDIELLRPETTVTLNQTYLNT